MAVRIFLLNFAPPIGGTAVNKSGLDIVTFRLLFI